MMRWPRLTGTYGDPEVDVQLLRLGDERTFLLVNRDAYGVQEYPVIR